MRLLFTAYGAYGHVLPMTSVAGALAREGHDVLFATSAELAPVVAACGLAPAVAGLDDNQVVNEARRLWPESASAPPGTWTPRMFCEIAAPAMARDLAPLIHNWRPDVVVREEGDYGGPLAASAAGVPWVTHGWGAPLWAPEELGHLTELLEAAWEGAGLQVPDGAALYGAAVLDPCPPSLYRTPPGIPLRCAVRPGVVQGDPVSGQKGRNRARLAYVGFGTVPLFGDKPDLIGAVVQALLDLEFEVTVTTSRPELAEALRALDPQRVNAEPWADLPTLMPLCGVVVCHGGAGTVLAALAAGLPLLLAPQGAPSQLRMTAACQARGVGRAFAWTGSNIQELRRLLSDVVSSQPMRNAAAAVADEIRAMPPAAAAGAVLEAVLSASA